MKFSNTDSLNAVINELTSDMRSRVQFDLEQSISKTIDQAAQEIRAKYIVEIMRSFEIVIHQAFDGAVEVTFRIEASK